MRARTVSQVIAGEAVSGTVQERWNDMVHIASVISNRAKALGVSIQDVIANTNEFNAYNRAMPPGTQDLTGMAEEAMKYVETAGPVTDATFYATPAAASNLPSGLLAETATTGHQYYSDPQNRAIGTAKGYKAPNAYAYAQNPENVPAPDQKPMAATGELGPSWTINGVAPALTPTVEGWSAMAAAQPVQSPMNSVTASGLLGSNPGLMASAAATPDTGLLSGVPDTSSFDMGRFGPTAAADASVPDTSNFDMSRFGPTPTPDTSSFDMSRFGPVSTQGFDQARFGPPSIDPATNTQSFMDAPQTAVATGINSPEHINGVQAQAERQLAATRAVQPSMSVPASGLLAANPGMEASATVPSLQSSYTATPSVTPAEQAINSIATPGMSPQQISGYQQAAASMAKAGMLNIGQQPPTDLSGNLPANFNVLSAPALDTVSVPDQPTIAGPATTEVAPAQEQQQTQQVQQAVTQSAAQPQSLSLGDKLKAAVNPGTAIGGLLGGVTMGPVGGLLGGLLGNAVNQGSFSGLLGGAPTMTNVGTGPQAAYGVWGGGMAPGSTATASDGSRVSAQAGGDVARTNSFGTTDVANSYGGYAGDFSGWY